MLIFVPNIENNSLIKNFDLFLLYFKDNYFLTILYLSCLIKLAFNFKYNFRNIDYVIILFFIIFILINKVPPIRIFVNFSYFYNSLFII